MAGVYACNDRQCSVELALHLSRGVRLAFRVCIAALTLLVWLYIFGVWIAVAVDEDNAEEGNVAYEFSIQIVVGYSLVIGVAFLLFGVVILVRLWLIRKHTRNSATVSRGVLAVRSCVSFVSTGAVMPLLQILVIVLVCVVCFGLRFAIFLYRPVTDQFFQQLIFYLYGYWIPEVRHRI